MNILVVDDNFASRRLLKAYLKPYGECFLATNGFEAISLFSENSAQKPFFDLICLDMMMPEMDGKEALRRIREFEKEQNFPVDQQVKVVMVTALDNRSDIVEAFDEGCSDYLVKPIEVNQLKECLSGLGFNIK